MKIIIIVMVKNEEYMLPFFLRHYDKIATEIHFWVNKSGDKTLEIIKSYPKAIINEYDTLGKMDDGFHMKVKNTYYHKFHADWFIVVDCDEFLYHEHLLELLEKYMKQGITLPMIKGYGMVSDKVPIDDGKSQIYELLKEGMPYVNYNKNAIFSPKVNINYDSGCHACRPRGRVVYSSDCSIKLLHYKMLSKEYVVEKAKKTILSEQNIRMRWGWEGADPVVMAQDWEKHWNNRTKVL